VLPLNSIVPLGQNRRIVTLFDSNHPACYTPLQCFPYHHIAIFSLAEEYLAEEYWVEEYLVVLTTLTVNTCLDIQFYPLSGHPSPHLFKETAYGTDDD